MEPIGIDVRYVDAGSGDICSEERESFAPFSDEAISVDDDIHKLIVSHATASDIMKVAKSKGTITMRQDGVLKVLAGITTIEEVNRVASDLA